MIRRLKGHAFSSIYLPNSQLPKTLYNNSILSLGICHKFMLLPFRRTKESAGLEQKEGPSTLMFLVQKAVHGKHFVVTSVTGEKYATSPWKYFTSR